MTSNFKFFMIGASVASFSFLLGSCGGSETDPNAKGNATAAIDKQLANHGEGQKMNIGGEIFSIPSPVQTAFLIKEVGTEFNSEILNPTENADNYSSGYLKALNLGIYGADLGYLTIYESNDNAFKYLAATRKMADQLGLEGAFDQKMISRFEKNLGNQDSILVLVSEAFKKSDIYLKENDKHDIAALVLAGGWIEAMYFASRSAVDTKDKRVIERLGDQKIALGSLIRMLEQYSSDQDYSDLAFEFEDLFKVFDGVKYTYDFVPPKHDEANKITHINSKHSVEMSDEDLNAIIEKIKAIRNEIVQ